MPLVLLEFLKVIGTELVSVTEKKSQPSPDIRLYLANKFEVEARAAAAKQHVEPTQVRDSIQPSRIATSARSESEAVRGDSIRQPNQTTLVKGEEQKMNGLL